MEESQEWRDYFGSSVSLSRSFLSLLDTSIQLFDNDVIDIFSLTKINKSHISKNNLFDNGKNSNFTENLYGRINMVVNDGGTNGGSDTTFYQSAGSMNAILNLNLQETKAITFNNYHQLSHQSEYKCQRNTEIKYHKAIYLNNFTNSASMRLRNAEQIKNNSGHEYINFKNKSNVSLFLNCGITKSHSWPENCFENLNKLNANYFCGESHNTIFSNPFERLIKSKSCVNLNSRVSSSFESEPKECMTPMNSRLNLLTSCNRCSDQVQNAVANKQTDSSKFKEIRNENVTSANSETLVPNDSEIVKHMCNNINNINTNNTKVSKLAISDQVIMELIETEEAYVKDLTDICTGYKTNVGKCGLGASIEDEIFGNIVEILGFSRKLLDDIQLVYNIKFQLAVVFEARIEDFFFHYSKYCNNFPKACWRLDKCMSCSVSRIFFEEMQVELHHSLPLASFLLKPIQRISKYHLFLHNLLKFYEGPPAERKKLEQTFVAMTSVVKRINGNQHDVTSKYPYLKSDRKSNGGHKARNLNKYIFGFENDNTLNFTGADSALLFKERVYEVGCRDARWIHVLEDRILIVKKKSKYKYEIKATIMCRDLMLIEKISKFLTAFQLIDVHQISTQFTFFTKSLETKSKICFFIKQAIIENFSVHIPESSKNLLLNYENESQIKGNVCKPNSFMSKRDRNFNLAPKYLRNKNDKILSNKKSIKESFQDDVYSDVDSIQSHEPQSSPNANSLLSNLHNNLPDIILANFAPMDTQCKLDINRMASPSEDYIAEELQEDPVIALSRKEDLQHVSPWISQSNIQDIYLYNQENVYTYDEPYKRCTNTNDCASGCVRNPAIRKISSEFGQPCARSPRHQLPPIRRTFSLQRETSSDYCLRKDLGEIKKVKDECRVSLPTTGWSSDWVALMRGCSLNESSVFHNSFENLKSGTDGSAAELSVVSKKKKVPSRKLNTEYNRGVAERIAENISRDYDRNLTIKVTNKCKTSMKKKNTVSGKKFKSEWWAKTGDSSDPILTHYKDNLEALNSFLHVKINTPDKFGILSNRELMDNNEKIEITEALVHSGSADTLRRLSYESARSQTAEDSFNSDKCDCGEIAAGLSYGASECNFLEARSCEEILIARGDDFYGDVDIYENRFLNNLEHEFLCAVE